jgi:hypothetical protein
LRYAKTKERLISDAYHGGDLKLPRHIIRKPLKGQGVLFFQGAVMDTGSRSGQERSACSGTHPR